MTFAAPRTPAAGAVRSLVDAANAIADAADPHGITTDRLPRAVELATRLVDHQERQEAVRIPGQALGWPLADLVRDLSVGTASAGGNLVGSPRATTVQALGGASILERLGAPVVTLPIGNPPGHPAVDTEPVATWATGEGAAVGENEPTFALWPSTMCTVGGRVNLTRRFMKSAGEAGDLAVRTALLRALARAIDAAALGGTGADGQPQGLAGTSGVYAQSGSSLGWAGVQNMLQQLGDAGADDDATVGFVGTPAVRELLAQRERAAGSGMVWADGAVDGHRAISSRACPSATLIAGDFRQLTLLIHGAVTVIVDRYTYATTGAVRLVVLADVAVVVGQPSAFAVASSVT